MWVAEGLTHRYPTKVLAELLPTCPPVPRPLHPDGPRRQLHADRGQAQVPREAGRPARRDDRLPAHLTVRDVVVSGGDVANMPWARLEDFLTSCSRSTTSATSAWPRRRSWGCPNTGCRTTSVPGWSGWRRSPRARLHRDPHPREPRQLRDPAGRQGGPRDARDRHPRRAQPRSPAQRRERRRTHPARPELRAARRAQIMPLLLLHGRHDPVQRALAGLGGRGPASPARIMGYLPGFATPRIVCDVPFVGKRWVHQIDEYDRELGISYWTKNYRTSIEASDPRR